MNALKIAGIFFAIGTSVAIVTPAAAQTAPASAMTPTPAPQPTHVALTSAELAKVAAAMARYGRSMSLDAPAAGALGLGDSSVPGRQFSGTDHWDGTKVRVHYFTWVSGDPNSIVLLYRDKVTNTGYGFATDATFVVKAAYVFDPTGVRPLPTDLIQPAFQAEIGWWSHVLENFKAP